MLAFTRGPAGRSLRSIYLARSSLKRNASSAFEARLTIDRREAYEKLRRLSCIFRNRVEPRSQGRHRLRESHYRERGVTRPRHGTPERVRRRPHQRISDRRPVQIFYRLLEVDLPGLQQFADRCVIHLRFQPEPGKRRDQGVVSLLILRLAAGWTGCHGALLYSFTPVVL